MLGYARLLPRGLPVIDALYAHVNRMNKIKSKSLLCASSLTALAVLGFFSSIDRDYFDGRGINIYRGFSFSVIAIIMGLSTFLVVTVASRNSTYK